MTGIVVSTTETGMFLLDGDTVQDHLKSAFGKTGVHSRGQLVATILQRDYLPRAIAGVPLTRSGAFAVG